MEHLFTFYSTPYTIDEFVTAFSPGLNPHFWKLFIVFGITFAFGYAEYVYSWLIARREGVSPFPHWMHSFYFAHDCMGAIIFLYAAYLANWFWFFLLAALFQFIFTLFEAYCMYKEVRDERNKIWGAYSPDGVVSKKKAWALLAVEILILFCGVNLFRSYFNDPCMFKWYVVTNMFMAIGPCIFWAKKKTPEGTSKGLAIVILLGTINTFYPGNPAAMANDFFAFHNLPWMYITGYVCIAMAIYTFFILKKLGPKEKISPITGKKTVW